MLKRFIILLIFSSPLISFAQVTAKDYLRYAIECTEKEDYVGAIALCNHSINLDPRNALAFYHRAYNRFLIGDIDGVITDSDRSLQLNPNLADAYLLRAEAKLKKGERFSAIADYNRARQIDGTITLAHFAQNIFNAIF